MVPLDSQLSHEKFPGWLDYIGDEILPSYIGVIINELYGSLLTNQDSMESRRDFFVAQLKKNLAGLVCMFFFCNEERSDFGAAHLRNFWFQLET